MTATIPLSDAPFLAGGGKAAGMILARDWSAHPLGPIAGWPEALKAALSLVVNSPESMILAWGRDDLHFFFNDTYFPLLGPRLAWAMGERFDKVWADGWAQAKPIIDEAFAGRSTRFVDLPWTLGDDRGATETWWSFSYSRVLDGAGEVAGLFIFTNETTARVRADAALEKALGDLRSLNNSLEEQVTERTAERDRMWRSSPDLMVVMDGEGRIVRVNPAWTTILDYDADELNGASVFPLMHPDDVTPSLAALDTAIDGPLPIFENRYRHKDGSYRWISWVAAPHRDLIYATGRHVTREKEAAAALHAAEEQLRQSQKIEAVGQLTGGVAHDFNNLLTVIRGSVELLRRPGLPEDKRARYIEAIADTADRAAKLTSQLLAFARRQTLRPELFDACASVIAMRDMLGTLAGPSVAIEILVPDCLRLVDADRNQFDTAIVNMAVNARDAMGGTGQLEIGVAVASRMPALRAHPAVEGQFVAVTVRDTGAGIAPEVIDHVFEPFFTTKHIGQGTGLGLSQVIGFAKQSGGDIAVASVKGQGSTFTLYLPLAHGEVRAAPPLAPPGPAASEGCVLVVEDNDAVGRFAREALAELGYKTILAADAAAALAELERRDGSFDIVFSDVVMPGMSGIELAAEIGRRYRGLPVVLASGYSTVLAEGGAHGYELLQKPYSIEGLSLALRRVAARA